MEGGLGRPLHHISTNNHFGARFPPFQCPDPFMGSGWRGQGKAVGMEWGGTAGWSKGLETENFHLSAHPGLDKNGEEVA